MKNIRVEDAIHERLTTLVGELTAESGRMKTYADAIENLLGTSVVLPQNLVKKIEDTISEGRLIGYKNHVEFVRDAVRDRLKEILEEEFYVRVPIPRKEYTILEKLLEEKAAPYTDPSDYLREHVHEIVEKSREDRAESKTGGEGA